MAGSSTDTDVTPTTENSGATTSLADPAHSQNQAGQETKAETPPEVKAEPAVPPVSLEEPKPAKRPWFERRIDELTAQKGNFERANQEKERRIQFLEATLSELNKIQGQTQGQTGTTPQTQPQQPQRPLSESDVESRAAQIASERAFVAECNKVYAEGQSAFPDFDNSVRTLNMLGGFTPAFVSAALETGSAPKVLDALAKNPDEARRIMELPPVRQAVALAKFSTSLGAPKAQSKAPPPIEPVTGNGQLPNDDIFSDKLDTKAWIALREKQLAEKRKH